MQDPRFRDMSRADRQTLEVLGAAIRLGRRRMGMSQQALADHAEVSQTAVSRLERGMAWGMAVIRFARVAWVLRERMPIGGCPHSHTCRYNTQWEHERRGVLDRIAAEFEPEPEEETRPAATPWSLPEDAVQPPAWWRGWATTSPTADTGRSEDP